jgi:MSHA pilin protein MshC
MRIVNQSTDIRGFSLIELVVVIILLSILAVTVAPRFSGKSGFAEYAYQARLISALRAMQTRAMHDTRPGFCFQINISSSRRAFGAPRMAYADADPSPTCTTVIDYTNPPHFATTATEMASENVRISANRDGGSSIFYIGFDNLGRPITSSNNCAAGCRIEFLGEKRIGVCIESEGYVHACP